ncbi:MAG: hypothetical protein U5M51_06330 [Emticicia sp.]|nr:hypothetical protein [Emticicia sp.]
MRTPATGARQGTGNENPFPVLSSPVLPKIDQICLKPLFSKNAKILIAVAALGYYVDVYDLILFGVVRNPSLASLGFDAAQQLSFGLSLFNIQMAGMLIGGIFGGVLG